MKAVELYKLLKKDSLNRHVFYVEACDVFTSRELLILTNLSSGTNLLNVRFPVNVKDFLDCKVVGIDATGDIVWIGLRLPKEEKQSKLMISDNGNNVSFSINKRLKNNMSIIEMKVLAGSFKGVKNYRYRY